VIRPGCRAPEPDVKSNRDKCLQGGRKAATSNPAGYDVFLKETMPMTFLRPIAAAAAVFLMCAASYPVRAEPFSDAKRSEIEAIVKDYLIKHPEVLKEALAEAERRDDEALAEKHKGAVKENAQLLFSSPRQVTLGNPQGDVTFVEFFDYNCGYCKQAMADMFDLMKNDGKLKVVLKEFPVLGPGSMEAARVAVAVRMQDKGGKKYAEFHQKLLGGRGQADRARAIAVAKEVGLDMPRLEKDMASPEAQASIDESIKLAESLGLNGTPSYVIGSDIVIGAVGLAALEKRIDKARKCSGDAC
jgi:protein-disulfide isomerase